MSFPYYFADLADDPQVAARRCQHALQLLALLPASLRLFVWALGAVPGSPQIVPQTRATRVTLEGASFRRQNATQGGDTHSATGRRAAG